MLILSVHSVVNVLGCEIHRCMCKMDANSVFFGIFSLLLCNHVGATEDPAIFTSVLSSHNYAEPILTIPSAGNTHFWKDVNNKEIIANKFKVTRDGRVYIKSSLNDMAGRIFSFDVNGKNIKTGIAHRQRVVINVLDKDKPMTEYHSRVRRAAEITINKTVLETAREIVLNYANAGVINSVYNRYYLLNRLNAPFSNVDETSGRLMVDMNRRLDFETAVSKQYQLTVFVNNTDNSNGMWLL